MSELKNCPFCQSASLQTPSYDVQPDGIWQSHVECNNCEARGPNAFWYGNDEEAEKAAIAAWNAIAASQPAQEPYRKALEDVMRWFHKYPEFKPAPNRMDEVVGAIEAAKAVLAQPAQEPTMVCSQCGADRFKEDCKGDRMRCDIRGTAQIASQPAQGDQGGKLRSCATAQHGDTQPAQGEHPTFPVTIHKQVFTVPVYVAIYIKDLQKRMAELEASQPAQGAMGNPITEAQGERVAVCPTLDRECGEYYGGWCATCPKARTKAQAERQPVGWLFGNSFWERNNPRLTDDVRNLGRPLFDA